MRGKLDCLLWDDDMALDYTVSLRLLLLRHDSTGLILRLFTGMLDQDEWRREGWWRRHQAFEDMCRLRIALKQGGYPVYCNTARESRCDRCPVVG